MIAMFKTFYGPVHKAFAALDAEAQRALHADMLGLVAHFDRSDDQTIVVPAEYLEIVITRRA